MTVKSHAKLEEKLVLCCDLCFEKLHEEFDKFSPEHSKVSKYAFYGVLLSKKENV